MPTSKFVTTKQKLPVHQPAKQFRGVGSQPQRPTLKVQSNQDGSAPEQPSQPLGNDDIRARIAKAKAYQKQGSVQQLTTASTVVSSSTQQLPSLQTASVSGRPDYFSSNTAASQSAGPATAVTEPNTDVGAVKGTSDLAAGWLKGVLSEEAMQSTAGIDQNLRAEEFTEAKEQRLRETEVEIISVDKGYKPKVSTWGVFPRPQNISAAYGGGRTIRPGEQLETEEEKKEREKKTTEMLRDYKKSIGALLEPEVQEKCDRLQVEAEALFKEGLLQAAYAKYEEILTLVPARTRMGGFASIQRAIIMDSFGYSEQAQVLYKSLVIHPTPEVAKRAKRMLFGFDAAKFLKTDTMDFSGKKQAWAKYFTQNSQVVYVQSEEEKARDAEASRQAALIAVAVMLGPVVVFGALALSK